MIELYEAEIYLRSGCKITVTGSLNDCTAAVHDRGNTVQKAKIRKIGR